MWWLVAMLIAAGHCTRNVDFINMDSFSVFFLEAVFKPKESAMSDTHKCPVNTPDSPHPINSTMK